MLKGPNIFLRAIEPEDATKVMIWENNHENWRVSGTEAPFSMHGILEYINSIQNFRQSGELRLMICLNSNKEAIGTLDLFEANFKHGRAGVGILIAEQTERNKGFAKESLELLKEYAKVFLGFHTLFANVLEDNIPSMKLFENCNFELVGTKKEWFFDHGKRINENMYQILLKK
ncbi:MAG: GNAT family protein [Bacteroidota bacterium]